MKITITIDTDNAAFDGDRGQGSAEVRQILHRWITRGWSSGDYSARLMDSNGNTVGAVVVDDDDQPTVAEFQRIPMTKWADRVASNRSIQSFHEIEREAAYQSVVLARLSAYISTRIMGGGHAQANKRQNQVARAVRKALGFAVAEDRVEL